jgi:hypothetical protein
MTQQTPADRIDRTDRLDPSPGDALWTIAEESLATLVGESPHRLSMGRVRTGSVPFLSSQRPSPLATTAAFFVVDQATDQRYAVDVTVENGEFQVADLTATTDSRAATAEKQSITIQTTTEDHHD